MKGIRLCLAAIAILTMQGFSAFAQDQIAAEIAPNGKLRGAVIPIKVLGGIGEPIGQFIAGRLGATFQPVHYGNPQLYEASFGKNEWDIALGPRVLAPADKADVTSDVWLIELLYLAAPRHVFANPAEVDHEGVKVATIQNSPSDRVLTRTLKTAEIVRLPLGPNFPGDAIELLRSGKADVFGADSGLISAIAQGYPDARIVSGSFSIVRAAIALPKGRSPAAQARLLELVNEAKATGVVERAIQQTGLTTGVRVAKE